MLEDPALQAIANQERRTVVVHYLTVQTGDITVRNFFPINNDGSIPILLLFLGTVNFATHVEAITAVPHIRATSMPRTTSRDEPINDHTSEQRKKAK
jgi:hypothetical protein